MAAEKRRDILAAKEASIRLLRVRPRSEKELTSRLEEKGFAELEIRTVIAYLKEKKFLDDEKFARLWVESRMQNRPVGDIVLKRELQEKGIAPATIDAALVVRDAGYDDLTTAKGLAEERWRRMAGLERRKAEARLFAFLARRGFSYAIVRQVMKDLPDLPSQGDA